MAKTGVKNVVYSGAKTGYFNVMAEQLQLKNGQDTPLIRQYLDIKEKCKDAILLYRLGDFYEMFFDDAVVASKVLDIALTARDKQAENPIPLCGVPHHSSKAYISKLLDAGFKVAICEQVEDPATAKGIVRREIVKVITSGTRSDEEGLSSNDSNFILSIFCPRDDVTLAWIDVSNGAVEVATFNDIQNAKNFILTLSPSEIVISDDEKTKSKLSFFETDPIFRSYKTEKLFPWIYEQAQKEILRRFNVSHLESLGIDDLPFVSESIFGLLHYVEEKNLTKVPHIQTPKRHVPEEYAFIDYTTQDNLEIFESKKSASVFGSLYGVLNQTVTGMGARELRSRMRKPLCNIDKINERLTVVEYLVSKTNFRNNVRKSLGKVTDIERVFRRIATKLASVGDLISLRQTLGQIPELKKIVQDESITLLGNIEKNLRPHEELFILLQNALGDSASVNISEGGFIRKGFDSELDRLKSISSQNQQWLAELETQERRRTGIPSLKISYNRVFGYYIEITKTHHDKVPQDYIRKQTLVSAERYITPELKEKELKIQGAKEKTIALELQILQLVREETAKYITTLQDLSRAIAELDVHTALAHAAIHWNYSKPSVRDQFGIEIKQGRHPIVERNTKIETFVPNDLVLSEHGKMILLTGPNMAGKSTVMRQVALIVFMAQIGSYVPAEDAVLGSIDRIFTRIGANDDLSGGRSTFMVEMNETAQILLNATEHSLILLDEIGRGTSTYDGLSIAWAVAEDIVSRIKAKTIFATHYHELTKLSATHPTVKNMRMAIREWKDQIVFLRKVEDGITERSYGIEVAQIAGVRNEVILRAKEILKTLESPKEPAVGPTTEVANTLVEKPTWATEFESIRVDDITPKQALDFLYDLQKKIKNS